MQLNGPLASQKRTSYVLLVVLALTGCNVDQWPVPNPPPPPKPVAAFQSRLRVRNVGSLPIRELIVLFPNLRVQFGDVEKGETSKYVDVGMVSSHFQWENIPTYF